MATTPTNKPIPSEDPRDLKFNAGKIDEVVTSNAHYYTDRFGKRRWTIAGFQYTAEEAIRNYGYITIDSFEDGSTLTLPNQVLRHEATGEYYRWDGDFPKNVPTGSTPESSGGIGLGLWLSVGDASLRSQLSSQNAGFIVDDSNIKVSQPDSYGITRSLHEKNADIISVKDFGAVGDGVVDDTAALTALAAWVNSRPKYSNPVTVKFPNGTYLYSGGLDFIRPVAIYGHQGATLKYTGSGKALAVGDPTPENAPTADNFYQGEYTIEGLRFTGGESATHGIFIKSFVFTPRIRNCLFIDFGNSASYDIYAQYEDWDGLIECCEKHTYFSTVATGSFIALVSKRTDGSAYDGGNSRFTIRDCSMGAYDNQELGYFAYINSVKCRVIGGNAHHSTGGILIGPNAHGTLVDGYYTEVSTTYRPWMISVLSDTSNPANYLIPQGVLIKNCYINMHSEKIGNNGRIIGMMDAGVKLRNWVVEDISVSTFQNGQVLIDMNNLDEQIGNVYNRITPIFAPYNSSGGAKFTVVNNPPLSPSAWTSGDVEEGTWTPNVGGTATYLIQKGTFRRDGRKVTVQFDLHINTIGTGNQSAILGLPFAAGSETGSGSVGYYVNLALNVYTLNVRVEALNSNLLLSGATASSSGISSYIAALGNNTRIIGNCTYFI